MVAPDSGDVRTAAEPAPAQTVIVGPPVDPVEQFRSLPLPAWERRGDYRDIHFDVADGMAKLTIARPEVRNAFRPQTLFELADAFTLARDDPSVGVIILTGEGPDAFCSGGDQKIRGDDGYIGDDQVARQGIGRLNVLDLQIQIRRTPKPVVAMVAGYAVVISRSAGAASYTSVHTLASARQRLA